MKATGEPTAYWHDQERRSPSLRASLAERRSKHGKPLHMVRDNKGRIKRDEYGQLMVGE